MHSFPGKNNLFILNTLVHQGSFCPKFNHDEVLYIIEQTRHPYHRKSLVLSDKKGIIETTSSQKPEPTRTNRLKRQDLRSSTRPPNEPKSAQRLAARQYRPSRTQHKPQDANPTQNRLSSSHLQETSRPASPKIAHAETLFTACAADRRPAAGLAVHAVPAGIQHASQDDR